MKRQNVRLVTYAWGRQYVDCLLDFTLASMLAPGNLPALAETFDCTLVLVTEESLFDYIRAHPLIQRAEAFSTLRLIPLDDLVAEPWQYGITLAYALFRGFAELGPKMTETYMLFLNADFVVADGSYRRLIPHIEAGESVLLSPSYCVVEERVRPLLRGRAAANEGVLSIQPREMAELILEHRHNTIRAKTVNQQVVHFEYMDQFYWLVDATTLLGHQMPIAMVAMQPERALSDIETFWDWGIVYDFCPSKQLTVLSDSDEFLMLELRGENTHLDLVRPGRGSSREIASRMTGYITEYQIDNSKFPLILHSQALPPNLPEAQSALRDYKDEILGHLPNQPIKHQNHAQWVYHKHHLDLFRQNRAQRSKFDEVASLLARLEKDFHGRYLDVERDFQREMRRIERRVAVKLEAFESAFTRQRRSLEIRRDVAIGRIKQAYLTESQTLRAKLDELQPREAQKTVGLAPTAGMLPQVITEAPVARRHESVPLQVQIWRWILGTFPDTRFAHPLYVPYRRTRAALRRVMRERPAGLLTVYPPDATLAPAIARLCGSVVQVSAAAVLSGGLRDSIMERSLFPLCIVEMSLSELGQAPEMFEAILPWMQPQGTVLLHWLNRDGLPREAWVKDLTKALLIRAPDLAVYYTGSRNGMLALRLATRSAKRALSLAASLPFAVAASIEERQSAARSQSSLPSPYTTSITIEICCRSNGRLLGTSP